MPLLERLIPDYQSELAYLSELGNAGFIMGFGLSYGSADHLSNHYPPAWTKLYEEENFLVGDPVLMWTLTRTGYVRWSRVRYPDPRKIMPLAARYGLRFGATCSLKFQGKRSFVTVARHDRELTDSEIEVLNAKFTIWTRCVYVDKSQFSEGELLVLRKLADDYTYAEIAKDLELSVSGVKVRLSSVQKKLGTKKPMSAVSIASALRII